MVIQRKTKNLGLNRSKSNPKVYDYIENVLGIKEKFCGRGKKGKLGKYGLIHQGKNPLPIREFYLLNAYINPSSGKVEIGKYVLNISIASSYKPLYVYSLPR